MALPINVSDLIQQRVIENARIEYKIDNWDRRKRVVYVGEQSAL